MKQIICAECRGNLKCLNCFGKGYYYIIGTNKKVTCERCLGWGICQHCKGNGKIMVP